MQRTFDRFNTDRIVVTLLTEILGAMRAYMGDKKLKGGYRLSDVNPWLKDPNAPQESESESRRSRRLRNPDA